MTSPETGNREPTAETPTPQPRIYAASLSDYNNGRLHGRWIDANQDVDAISEEIGDMLAGSRFDPAEEWAIHDYEGFGALRLSEYESLEDIAMLGQGIVRHGEVFAGFAAALDIAEWHRLLEFDDHYRGSWPSVEDYAVDLLEGIGIDLDEIGPEILQPYIRVDLEAFARDLSTDLILIEDATGGVHVLDRDL